MFYVLLTVSAFCLEYGNNCILVYLELDELTLCSYYVYMYTIKVNFNKEIGQHPKQFKTMSRGTTLIISKSAKFSIVHSQYFLPLKITRLCSYTTCSSIAQTRMTI